MLRSYPTLSISRLGSIFLGLGRPYFFYSFRGSHTEWERLYCIILKSRTIWWPAIQFTLKMEALFLAMKQQKHAFLKINFNLDVLSNFLHFLLSILVKPEPSKIWTSFWWVNWTSINRFTFFCFYFLILFEFNIPLIMNSEIYIWPTSTLAIPKW